MRSSREQEIQTGKDRADHLKSYGILWSDKLKLSSMNPSISSFPLCTRGSGKEAPLTSSYSQSLSLHFPSWSSEPHSHNCKIFRLFFLKLWLHIQFHHILWKGKKVCQKDDVCVLNITTAPNTSVFDLSSTHQSQWKTIAQASHVHHSHLRLKEWHAFLCYLIPFHLSVRPEEKCLIHFFCKLASDDCILFVGILWKSVKFVKSICPEGLSIPNLKFISNSTWKDLVWVHVKKCWACCIPFITKNG